ncbi:MAG TPA: tetratricopeptide repeat protein [Verrucomicrobiae bacterium]|nr:tetratricopeptide repeat protein [Verrucomicrobiae bacterium]
MTPTFPKPVLKFLICVFLAAITFAVYAGVSRCSFIALDDWVYVVDNPNIRNGFSWSSIKWALDSVYAGYWIPVTWLVHIADCQFYGLHPGGHHVTNLIFHIANTVLLFLLLEKLTTRLWPSAFVALLFGIHPMHVESVAWVAELKDVLSSFFFLLTLLAYTAYARRSKFIPQSESGNAKPASGQNVTSSKIKPPRDLRGQVVGTGAALESDATMPSSTLYPRSRWLAYSAALFAFVLGLMAKPMLVTLPFVLLLLDFWPLKRFNVPALRSLSEGRPKQDSATLQRLFFEKLPFFLLAAFFSYVTFLAERLAGAVKPTGEFSVADRFGHVPVSFVWYLAKFFWPANLSVLYMWHKGTTSDLEIMWASLLLLGMSAFALFRARANPCLLVGWLWFLGMLFPVIGIVQAGDQAYADRFAYLPYIGLSIIIAWGIPEVLAKVPSRGVILWTSVAVIGVACCWRTVVELGYWKDGLTLLNRAVALDPKNEMAWGAMGFEYEVQGNYAKALDCERRALSVNNRFYLAWNYLAHLLAREKDYAGAENAYQTALSFMWFREDRIDGFNRLGDTFESDQKYALAAAAYQNSLALDSNQADTEGKLGQCLLKAQQPDSAAAAFQRAIALQPDNPNAYVGLGMISQGQGLDSDAVADYRAALKADPDTVLALNNLAWILAADSDPALRNGSEAVSLAEHACQLTHYHQPVLIGTLAAAYAEAGQFDKAVATAQKAHDIALAQGDQHRADRNMELMKLYKAHKAFHMGPD